MRRTTGFVTLGLLALASVAHAQTTTGTTTPTTTTVTTTDPTGSFAKLSPGNQKIAQSVFDAQSTTGTAPKLTRDQIAAMKLSGRGWGEIFKELKAERVVTEKNLGQAIREHERQVRAERGERHDRLEKAEKVERAEKPERLERAERPERPERGGRR